MTTAVESRPQRGHAVAPEAITLDMEFGQEGGEGPTPHEVLLDAVMIGDSKRSACRRHPWVVPS